MSDTIVDVARLYEGEGEERWEYVKRAEMLAMSMICRRKKMHPSSVILSEGYFPEYDAILDDEKYEIKFSSLSHLSVEYARTDNYPAALFLSHADYYLTISPGKSQQNGQWQKVGKVRLYKKNVLIKHVLDALDVGEYEAIQPNKLGPGARYVTLDPKQVKHIWIGDIELIQDQDGDKQRTLYVFPEEIIYDKDS